MRNAVVRVAEVVVGVGVVVAAVAALAWYRVHCWFDGERGEWP